MAHSMPLEIQAFLQASENLAKILQQEIQYVKNKEFQAMENLQAQKNKAVTSYGQQLTLVKPIIPMLDTVTKAHALHVTEQLNLIAEENTLLLKSAHDDSQRILSVLHDVAQKTQKKFKAYGSNGVYGAMPVQAYANSAVPLTHDQRI